MTEVEIENMKNRKNSFVKNFERFYIEEIGNPVGLSGMDYELQEKNGFIYESVVVRFGNDKKRFDVNGDSNQAIVKDFFKFLDNFDAYRWIIDEAE